MATCKVCGKELEKGIFMWKYPFDKDERKIHKGCLGRAYELCEELRLQMGEHAVSMIVEEVGVSVNDAWLRINGVKSMNLSRQAESLVTLFHARFGARPDEPIDPFAVKLEKQMVGNLLTVRIPD